MEAMESELIPESTQASNDGACNSEFVTNYEGATDRHSLYLLVLGWTAIHHGIRDQLVGDVTSRVTYAAPRDPVEQGVHLSPEEDTAKPFHR